MAAKKAARRPAKKAARRPAKKAKAKRPVRRWTVVSDRLPWTRGTVLTTDDLAGLNVSALVAAGHLEGPG